jgi:hypothetical protein
MAKQDVVVADGASGKKYSFDVYPWNDLDVPGGTILTPLGVVYMVLRKNVQNRYDVLYVGQSGGFPGRFDNHHKQACFDRNAKTHVGVHLCGTERERLVIEADLTKKYNPPCNA